MTTGYRSWADERRDKLQLLMLDILGVILTIAGIVLIVLAGMHVTNEAIQQHTRRDRKPEPIYTAQVCTATLSRPAAFRMRSPTQDQMDKLHELLRVSEVRTATGEVPDGSDS